MSSEPVCPPKLAGSDRSEEEHYELWRAYVVDGLSAANTAKRLNRLFPDRPQTKDSVVGYAHRSGLAAQHVRAPDGSAVKRLNQATTAKAIADVVTRIKPSKRLPGPKSTILADLDPVIGARFDVALNAEVDVIEKSCRWPVGPVLPPWRMSEQLFCGEVQNPALAPYCPDCAAVAYGMAGVARKLLEYAQKNQRA
jgi:hypothetical protein